MRPRNDDSPSLLPREHGSYGQLAFPALCAVILTGARLPGLAVTGAAVAAFLMHEPLLVMLGLRGTRAKREQGARARVVLGALAIVVAALATLAVATSTASLAGPLGLSAVLGAGVLLLVVRRQERTAMGEILAAAALASTAVPVMAAGGAGVTRAVWVWLIWTVASVVVILPIRALVARGNKASARLAASSVALTVLAALAVLSSVRALAFPIAWAIVPSCVFALVLCATAPRPQRLRAVGWSAIAVSLLTTTTIVLTA